MIAFHFDVIVTEAFRKVQIELKSPQSSSQHLLKLYEVCRTALFYKEYLIESSIHNPMRQVHFTYKESKVQGHYIVCPSPHNF